MLVGSAALAQPNYQRKPGPSHTVAFNRSAPLTNGLVCLMLFENPLLGGSLRDYAAPSQRFTNTGTTFTITVCPYGGQALNTSGAGSDLITLGTAFTSSNIYTFSSLVKFNGTIPGASIGGIICNAGETAGIGYAVGATNGGWTDFTGGVQLKPAIDTLTTWTRVTISVNSGTATLYYNGVKQNTASWTASTFAFGAVCAGWPLPMADLFVWNRVLDDMEVQGHAARPYVMLNSGPSRFLSVAPLPRWGWEPRNEMMSLPQRRMRPAIMERQPGGNEAFIRFFPWGRYPQEWQPPHRRPERALGAIARGDDGNEAPFQRYFTVGWQPQDLQPPHGKPERAGAVAPFPNIDAVYSSFVPIGWQPQDVQPPHPHPGKSWQLGPVNIDATYQTYSPVGWQPQDFQPPRPVQERGGVLAAFPNIDATLVAAVAAFAEGWQIQDFQPRTLRYNISGAIQSFPNIDATYRVFTPTGWQPLDVQPPHPRPERSGAVARGDDGTEASFANFFSIGWQPLDFQPPHRKPERAAGWLPAPWPVEATYSVFNPVIQPQEWQPPHPRRERAGAIARGDEGTEAQFANFFSIGWQPQDVQPPHRKPERAGAIVPWINLDALYSLFVPLGWQPQDVQPPRRRTEAAGSIMPWPNIDAVYRAFFSVGFQPYDVQPPHPRPERSGAIARWDDGTEAVFVPPGLIPLLGWAYDAPYVFPRKRFNILTFGDDGIQYPLLGFRPYGWEPQTPMLRHPRPERGALLPSPFVIDARFSTFTPMGWVVQDTQPPHRRPERFGALETWPNIDALLVTAIVRFGWQPQDFQPPHPQPERAGALARGDDGIEAAFQRFIGYGWASQDFLAQHPRRERGAALLWPPFIDAAYNVFVPSGWEPAPPMLRRPPRTVAFDAQVLFRQAVQFALSLGATNAQIAAIENAIGHIIAASQDQSAGLVNTISKILHAHMGVPAARGGAQSVQLGATTASSGSLVKWFSQFLIQRGRVVLLPPPGEFVTLPSAIIDVTLPEPEEDVSLPPIVTTVLLPTEEEEMSGFIDAEPLHFSTMDPTDENTVTFDWSRRAYPNDRITFASVVSVPTGVNFIGPAFINGYLVDITVGPTSPPEAPTVYGLRCTAVFASGRVSNYTVPIEIKPL